MNHIEFELKLREKRPNTKVLGDYTGAYKPIEFQCRTHGIKFTMAPCKVLHKRECSTNSNEECKHQRKIAATRTKEEVIRRIREIHGNKIEVLRLSDPLRRPTVKCTTCEHVWTPSQSNLITHGRGCTKCGAKAAGDKMRKSTAQFKEELFAKTQGTVKLIGEYAGAKRHNTYHCTVCEHTWTVKGGGKCSVCGMRKVMRSGLSCKTYTLGKRKVSVQGYEPIALDIIQGFGVSPKNIWVESEGKVPMIEYHFQGKTRKHYPDIRVRKSDGSSVIIEVKSTYTFGLGDSCWEHYWNSNKAKVRAALAQGIDYRFMLIDKKKLVPLPKLWYTMPRSKLRKLLGFA